MIKLLKVLVPVQSNAVGELTMLIISEGLLGVAIVSGVALTAGLVGSMLWKGLARKQ